MAEVVLLDAINASARQAFEGAGYSVAAFEKSVTPEGLAELTDGARVLGVRSGPAVPPEVLSDSLEVVDVFGVGTNHITRSAAGEGPAGTDEKGVAIFNSAHENTRSVAELVIGSTFSLFRDLGDHNRAMHDGQWTKSNGLEVRGKTMGIVGYGNIGAQVSVLAEAVGMDVVAFDPAPPGPPQGRAHMLGSLEEVLQRSDVVTLHAPGHESTLHMIDADRLALMKPGSFLINAARGDLVDYEAVGEALDSGQLGGVAVDVYTDASIGVVEPAKKGDAFEHELRGHERALLLPHIGGSTQEAQRKIGETVALRSIAYLETGSSVGSVNIPHLSLGAPDDGTSRLLNIHDNHAGVMAELNGLISEAGLNIVGAQLATNRELGYAVFDVEGEIPEELTASAVALEATRRVRVIA